ILYDITELFKKYSAKKEITLTAVIEPDVLILADPTALARIANNLVENAIKYTDEKGEITVLLETNGDNVSFVIRDSGIGIAPSLHERIFDPYYQINREKSNLQGMGLGLPIVKKIIGSLYGTIDIQSD